MRFELTFSADGPLGLRLGSMVAINVDVAADAGGGSGAAVCVTGLGVGSAAALSGRVRVGDVLVRVNGRALDGTEDSIQQSVARMADRPVR
jgi:hypothetical protein